jgi:hypothetical protein
MLWAIPASAGPAEDEAAAAAKTWLAVVDAKKYPESWKDAAEVFQQGVSESKWDGMVQSVRDTVGPVKSREVQSAKFTKTLPGVPDGDYAIVSFQTASEPRVPRPRSSPWCTKTVHGRSAGISLTSDTTP